MALFSNQQSFLGIDIGTSSIKMVELTKSDGRPKLLTYGFSEDQNINIDFKNNTAFAANVLKKVLEESGAVSRTGIASLPTFSVFSSILNLSKVDEKDLAGAIHWEAKKVIPLPLDEMILDWKKISNDEGKGSNTKVLLTGAPKTLVKKYIDIFKQAQVSLLSLETETFSLIRSLIGNDQSPIILVEIGNNTTDITIVNKNIPTMSRSIDTGGLAITNVIKNNFKLDFKKAEQFKYDLGITSMDSKENLLPEVIAEAISPIINEIKYTINLFQNKDGVKLEKVVLSGGSAMLFNFSNYLSKILDMKVIIGSPWSRIAYPEDIGRLLNEIGPKMSVASGLALREVI